MFFSKSKIGFTKITEKTVTPSYCEAVGTNALVNIVVDTHFPGIVYAATDKGDIHIYEASSSSSSSKGESMDCRPKGRLFVP